MKFLLVDDEILSLKNLARILKKLYPQATLITADNYKDALDAQDDSINVAFLDIEMPGMNGVELAKHLVDNNKNLNIIFVTAYDEYAREAYRVHASSYLTKPYNISEIARELENLRYPLPVEEDNKLRVQCFGNFEVFMGDQPIHFERKGAKEIFAYLVNLRGASASRMEICTAMWGNPDDVDRRKTYFRTLIFSLRNTLRDCESEDIFVNHRDSYAINTNAINCDYYRYLNGEKGMKVQFRGEYMSQYPWSVTTLNQLKGTTRD